MQISCDRVVRDFFGGLAQYRWYHGLRHVDCVSMAVKSLVRPYEKDRSKDGSPTYELRFFVK